MRPIDALQDVGRVLRTGPEIVAFMAGLALLATLASSAQVLHPLATYPAMAVLYLVLPFLIAGIVAYVDGLLDGGSSPSRFIAAGKRHYLGVLGGMLGLAGLIFVVYLVVAIVGFVVLAAVIGASLGTGGEFSAVALAAIAIYAVLAFLAVMVPIFLFQFYAAAIVLEDVRVVASFKRSAALVRDNLASVAGFWVIGFVIGLLAQVPTAYLFAVAVPSFEAVGAGQTIFDLLSRRQLVIYAGLSLVTGTVTASISYPYYVAFYRRLPGTAAATGDGTASEAARGESDAGAGEDADVAF